MYISRKFDPNFLAPGLLNLVLEPNLTGSDKVVNSGSHRLQIMKVRT